MFWRLVRLLHCEKRRQKAAFARGRLMDPKLAILILLISGIVALSHLNEESLQRMRRQIVVRHWRQFVPKPRKP
jgi:hypothetical protein